jgi:hypothetical protein
VSTGWSSDWLSREFLRFNPPLFQARGFVLNIAKTDGPFSAL